MYREMETLKAKHVLFWGGVIDEFNFLLNSDSLLKSLNWAISRIKSKVFKKLFVIRGGIRVREECFCCMIAYRVDNRINTRLYSYTMCDYCPSFLKPCILNGEFNKGSEWAVLNYYLGTREPVLAIEVMEKIRDVEFKEGYKYIKDVKLFNKTIQRKECGK